MSTVTEKSAAPASDRTARAVITQLRAMSCEKYEVGVRDSVSGAMILRTWNAADLEHALAWLRRMNARSNDIYIRPAGSVGLILVDDLTRAAVIRLTADHLAPAVVIETSPGNYQAWLRILQQPIPPELATAAARIVAERFGGDPNSADWRHFGRLAGFTNRKRVHERDGMQPYVLVHDASGAVAEQGAQLLMAAQEVLAAARAPQRTASLPPGEPHVATGRSPREAYLYYAARIRARHSTIDYSRLDWSVCKAIACTTLEADQSYLEQAMREGSPGLEERKAGHVDDYVARTARKVLQDSHVVVARERLAQKVTAQQGQGLIV